MAKQRGLKRWKRKTRGLFQELMAGEILADSTHQKYAALPPAELEKRLSRILGSFRRALSMIGWEQKTMKRWLKPAPNQTRRTRENEL